MTTPTGADIELVFDADELAALSTATRYRGLLGLDGGSGYIATWADPAAGARTLQERGLMTAGEQVAEGLQQRLNALCAGPVRLGLTLAQGPVRTSLLASYFPEGAYVAHPEPGGDPVRIRLALFAHEDVLRLVDAAVGDSGARPADDELGPERTIPLSSFIALGDRLLLGGEAEADLLRQDLLGWGLSPKEAGSFLDYLENGGRSVLASYLQVSGDTGIRDEQMWFGTDGDWWTVDEHADAVGLRSATIGTALGRLRALHTEAVAAVS